MLIQSLIGSRHTRTEGGNVAPTSEQARIIADLKSAQPREVSIPVVLAEESAAGFLRPLTHQMAGDPNIVDALFRWRREHMTAFLTVFVPTPEKTRSYLMDFSLPDPARILFLIERDNRDVGHIGLCNITPDQAEIDNVIRGERIDLPNFMVCAHNALLHWAFSTLNIHLAYLNVLSSNSRAIRTYEKVGLRSVRTTHLTREEFDGGYRLKPASASHMERTAPALIRMELSRDSFYRARLRKGSFS